MKSFPKMTLLIVALYAIFAFSVNFHWHPAGNESEKLQCNLCQASHISVDVTDSLHLTCEASDLGLYQLPLEPNHIFFLSVDESGRAPPLS